MIGMCTTDRVRVGISIRQGSLPQEKSNLVAEGTVTV